MRKPQPICLIFILLAALVCTLAASADQAITVGMNGIPDLYTAVSKIEQNAGNVYIYLSGNTAENTFISLPGPETGLQSVSIVSLYGTPVTISMNGGVFCASGVPLTIEKNVTLSNGFLVGGNCLTKSGTAAVQRTDLTVNGSADIIIGGSIAMASGASASAARASVVLNGSASYVFGGGYALNGGKAEVTGLSNVYLMTDSAVAYGAYAGGFADGYGSSANVAQGSLVSQGRTTALYPQSGLTQNNGTAQVGTGSTISVPVIISTPVPAVASCTINVGYGQTATDLNRAMEQIPYNAGNVILNLTGNLNQAADVEVPVDRGITSVTVRAANGSAIVYWGEETGFFANGIPLIIEKGVTFSSGIVYGGANVPAGGQSSLQSATLQIDGIVNKVVGGSKAKGSGASARVNNTYVTLSGKVQGWIYGGGSALYGGYSSVDGTAAVILKAGSSAAQSIAGGGFAFGSGSQSIVNNAFVEAAGSVVYAIYGGGYADQKGNSSVSGTASIVVDATGNIGQSVWYGGRGYNGSTVYVGTAAALVNGAIGQTIHYEGRATENSVSSIGSFGANVIYPSSQPSYVQPTAVPYVQPTAVPYYAPTAVPYYQPTAVPYYPPRITGITLSGSDKMESGTTLKLYASVTPSNANAGNVIWSSSNPGVASVRDGVVSAQYVSSPQTVTITVQSNDGGYIRASKNITVYPHVTTLGIRSDSGDVKDKTINLSPESGYNTLQLYAVASYTANDLVWRSSDEKVAAVSSSGKVTAKRAGKATITLSSASMGQKASVYITVANYVNTITLSGDSRVMSGKTLTLNARVKPSNVSYSVLNWTTGDSGLLSVSKTGTNTDSDGKTRGYAVFNTGAVSKIETVEVKVKATDGSGVSEKRTITILPKTSGFQLWNANGSVNGKTLSLNASKNQKVQLYAFSASNVDPKVSWSSSNGSVVKVSADGLVEAVGNGDAVITVRETSGDKRSASVTVHSTICISRIEISGKGNVISGKSIELTAGISPEAAAKNPIKWSSSDKSVATVSDTGVVTAKTVTETKTVVITAKAQDDGGVTGTKVITVLPLAKKLSIRNGEETVSGKEITVDLNKSKSLTLSAKVQPEGASASVNWKSSDKEVAEVDEKGNVTFKRQGSVTITAAAKDGSGISASTTIHSIRSVQSINISGDAKIVSGKKKTLTAEVLPANAADKTIQWSSSDKDALSVTQEGVVKAGSVRKKTDVTITAKAKDGSGVSGKWTMSVLPLPTGLSIQSNGKDVSGVTVKLDWNSAKSVQLSSVSRPEDAPNGATWSSSDANIATVDQNGNVTFKTAGKVTITAKSKYADVSQSVTVSCTVKKVKSITLSGKDKVYCGESITLTAEVSPSGASQKLKWSSSDSSAATVKNGVVTAKSVDEKTTVTITAAATDDSGVSGSMKITVMPRAAKVRLYRDGKKISENELTVAWKKGGVTVSLSADTTPSGASNKVKWSSSDSNIASVDEKGTVTFKKTGTVKITATAADGSGVSKSIKLTAAKKTK